MKTVWKALKYYAVLPFLASLPGLVLSLCGAFRMQANILVIPVSTALLYVLFRKKLDMPFAAKANGAVLLALLLCFTGMMIAADGNDESALMSWFSCLILPFFPIIIIMDLTGNFMLLYVCALLSYLTAFAVAACFAKLNPKKLVIPAAAAVICLAVSTAFYLNRPTVRYSGHGFEYMHGYSSTDFTDYTVFAEHAKLAELDHAPAFQIENEADMPVLDGAEACYPLYAAFAKAVYKDIGKIEKAAEQNGEYASCNGKIVSFTNTVWGFNRLIEGEIDPEKAAGGVDMFFGARPSADQMKAAEARGVELEITPIGKEAFVFFVEKDNPIENLTTEELKAIYHGDLTNWRELGGRNQKILAFQRPENSGSQTMMEAFMGELPLKKPQTYETVDAMMGVIREVAQYADEKGAIGYSFRYFVEVLNQEENVKLLSVDGVYPTLETIEDGSYPLTVSVCLVTRKNESNPNVQKMIDFILSDDGQELIRKTGYAGLHQEESGQP